MTAESPRPARLVLVAGTATEIGKTWVTARVAGALRSRGIPVAARKPAQSFEPGEGPTDAEVLGAGSGEEPDAVCPRHRWYPRAMAPPMAADVLGRPPFTIGDLVAELRWPAGCAVGLLESAGGVRSPLASDGDTVALRDAVRPDLVVLVADAGLGTINGVRLSLAALATPGGSGPTIVFLNRFDPDDDLHCRNRAWLEGEDGSDVRTTLDDLTLGVHPDAVGSSGA